MMRTLLIAVLIAVPFVAQGQEIIEPVESETPVAIGMPISATETVIVRDATMTVEIPKAEYEALKKAAIESQRLVQKRNQLVLENEALTAELAVWKQRLARVLRCQTIQEAIEELQIYSGNNEEK